MVETWPVRAAAGCGPDGVYFRSSLPFTTGEMTMASKKKATSKKAAGQKKVEIQDLPKGKQNQEELTDEQARNVKGGLKEMKTI
jgi:hypothetical protein